MKKYKVLRLETGATPTPPNPCDIEKAIKSMTSQGWCFIQLESGGVGGAGFLGTWVYLLFEREH